MSNTTPMSLDAAHKLAFNALTRQGFSEPQAKAISDTVTAAERDACTSHGLFRIPFYINALKNPSCNATSVPTITAGDSAVVHVDALNGFCPIALQTGLPSLIEKTRIHGIAALAIHNTYNIAALWPEVEQLGEEGLVAMAFTAANSFVAPAGGIKPIFGTNPMAFAWPRGDKPPLVFDQASSACARGEIQLHLRDGKPIPEGWAVDANGNPTTDPAAALEGAQLPFGGHKGSSLALMIELLAGALLGDLFSYESSQHDKHKVGAPFGGELVIAIDPTHFAPATTKPGGSLAAQTQHAEQLFAKILEQDGTRLPSSRRHKAREESLASGIHVATSLVETLQDFTQ